MPATEQDETATGYNSEDECGPRDSRDSNYDEVCDFIIMYSVSSRK